MPGFLICSFVDIVKILSILFTGHSILNIPHCVYIDTYTPNVVSAGA